MIHRLIAALWLGSAFFLMLAASAAFRVAPTATMAAEVVGAMLTRWHYIALAAPLALFVMELRRGRPLMLSLLFFALVLAATQGFVDLRIRNLRASASISITELSRDHPLRRRFGALHGVSMMLLVAQMLTAAAVVALPSKEPPAPLSTVTEPVP